MRCARLSDHEAQQRPGRFDADVLAQEQAARLGLDPVDRVEMNAGGLPGEAVDLGRRDGVEGGGVDGFQAEGTDGDAVDDAVVLRAGTIRPWRERSDGFDQGMQRDVVLEVGEEAAEGRGGDAHLDGVLEFGMGQRVRPLPA